MSNTLFTSDTHFFHKNILKFCPDTRKGEDQFEMNEILVEMWNDKVKPGDTVYHMGDVAFGQPSAAVELLYRLNGNIILVKGNHDHKLLEHPKCRARFSKVAEYTREVVNGQSIVMFHYPIKEWDQMHRGTWHLYGHVHGKDMGLGDRKAMDVGTDSRPDMAPWSFDEVKAVMDTRSIANHHGD